MFKRNAQAVATLTMEEVLLLLAIAAQADPTKFEAGDVQNLIYGAKETMQMGTTLPGGLKLRVV